MALCQLNEDRNPMIKFFSAFQQKSSWRILAIKVLVCTWTKAYLCNHNQSIWFSILIILPWKKKKMAKREQKPRTNVAFSLLLDLNLILKIKRAGRENAIEALDVWHHLPIFLPKSVCLMDRRREEGENGVGVKQKLKSTKSRSDAAKAYLKSCTWM